MPSEQNCIANIIDSLRENTTDKQKHEIAASDINKKSCSLANERITAIKALGAAIIEELDRNDLEELTGYLAMNKERA